MDFFSWPVVLNEEPEAPLTGRPFDPHDEWFD
jgi:hypothetical protein